MTVADEDPEFLDKYNHVISDEKKPNSENNNDTDDKEQEDGCVTMKLRLPIKDDDGLIHTIVKRCKMDDEGKAVVTMINNQMLDTREYKVEFSDGTTEVITANIIANNVLEKVDEKGQRQILLDEIIDHSLDVNAIGKGNTFTEITNGMKRK